MLYLYSLKLFLNIIFFRPVSGQIAQNNLGCIAHNVLAVCDGFVARISKPKVCRATKLWRSEALEWSEAK